MMIEGRPRLILASQSRSRRNLLEASGLSFEAIASSVDEPKVRRALEASAADSGPEDVARELAAAKALDISEAHPDAMVVGGDQVLALGDKIYEKPPDLDAARRQLTELRGRTHVLISAVALAQAGQIVWQHAETAQLTVRAFSPAFLDRYVDGAGGDICLSVGAYQLEGLGAQLFDRIDGDYFTILGLPLVPLLGALRARGIIET